MSRQAHNNTGEEATQKYLPLKKTVILTQRRLEPRLATTNNEY